MSFDPHKDSRRLRLYLVLAASWVLIAFALAAHKALTPEWQDIQREFFERFPSAGDLGSAIRQRTNCAGHLDRCTTCHLGIDHLDRVDPDIPQPFRAHPRALSHHLHLDVGCGLCHGGVGRALTAARAHAQPGTQARDPLMTQPHIQASCGRCHLPGAVRGTERLVAGAGLYLELGCPVCHPLTAGGRGGYDYGPDLRSIGRRSLAYLKASLMDPATNFAESTMPGFERTFRQHPEALTDLLIYLQGLALESPPACRRRARHADQVQRPCAACHAGPGGRASGRATHRCPFIRQRTEQLRCLHCHPKQVPEPGPLQGRCPVVEQRRPACIACHPG